MGKATTSHPALVGLTEKRRRFVLAYVGEAMGNASEAARIAGYTSPGQQGHVVLKNHEVQAALSALAATAEKRAIATSEELRERLTSIAMGTASDLEARASDVVAAAKLLLTVSGDLVKRVEHSERVPRDRRELAAALRAKAAELEEL